MRGAWRRCGSGREERDRPPSPECEGVPGPGRLSPPGTEETDRRHTDGGGTRDGHTTAGPQPRLPHAMRWAQARRGRPVPPSRGPSSTGRHTGGRRHAPVSHAESQHWRSGQHTQGRTGSRTTAPPCPPAPQLTKAATHRLQCQAHALHICSPQRPDGDQDSPDSRPPPHLQVLGPVRAGGQVCGSVTEH